MTTARALSFFLLALFASALTSCQVVGDIFKAGAWTALIGVVLVVALVWWLISKLGGGTPS